MKFQLLNYIEQIEIEQKYSYQVGIVYGLLSAFLSSCLGIGFKALKGNFPFFETMTYQYTIFLCINVVVLKVSNKSSFVDDPYLSRLLILRAITGFQCAVVYFYAL